jgi:hypothetical protein
MFKKIQYGLIALIGLLIPLMGQAATLCGGRTCDFTFTAVPAFPNMCIGQVAAGTYTIRNNTPVTVKINYIRIKDNDPLPALATAILPAPLTTCGSSLGAGASCNIRLHLLPLALGVFNRILQIGIDTRQVEIAAPPITTAVNCSVAPPGPVLPPTPVPPFTPVGPASLYQVSILGASTITNTGATVVNGDVDLSPGSAIVGFGPGGGTLTPGSEFHIADAVAAQARLDATTFYNDAVALPCTANLTGQDLGGQTLPPGVYCFDTSAGLTGTLNLAGTSSNSSYTFRIGSTLTTAVGSQVILTGGVVPDNVTWAVGSSATIGTGTNFAGIIVAVTSITLQTGATLDGRAWALNGAVTLDNNLVDPVP